jgi:hypothetical protein
LHRNYIGAGSFDMRMLRGFHRPPFNMRYFRVDIGFSLKLWPDNPGRQLLPERHFA